MKWGQQNKIFGTMRLRGEKWKKRKDENINKIKIKYYEIIIKLILEKSVKKCS